MNDYQSNESGSTITLDDIYYILFRHKFKILFLSLLGLIAAAAFWVLKSPPWQSEAKLLIRYVSETKSPTTVAGDGNIKSPDDRGESLINTEIQILTSFDLAEQVAHNIGPAKILGKTGISNDLVLAATALSKGLIVDAPQRGSVLQITFKHPDRTLVQPVLNSVIDTYFRNHLEIHRAGGVLGSYLSKETDALRTQITQLEKDLQAAREKSGVLSLDDATKLAEEEVGRIQQEIFDAQADMAEHQAMVEQLNKSILAKAPRQTMEARPSRKIPGTEAQAYRNVNTRLKVLYAKESQLLSQFTEETSLVRDIRHQISEAEATKSHLEQDYPEFLSTPGLSSISSEASNDQKDLANSLASETARVASLGSRIKVLEFQQKQIRDQTTNLASIVPVIEQLLERKKQAEARYKSLSASLEQYQLDDSLGTGKGLNISRIQAPSPPFKESGKRIKTMLMLLAGGLFGGMGLAFTIDRYLDRTVKRPKDFEDKLNLPLFLTIPRISKFSTEQLGDAKRMLLHCEALSGRVVANLQARGVTHKPKLVAVTAPGPGCGVTTIASGLAACLSEMGDGNVLLVDMNEGQEAVQKFYKGKPACGLEVALARESRDEALVQDNLYVVAANGEANAMPSILPRNFAKLLPRLRATDYDFIVFDMPPVTQTSITARVAGLMDLVLFAVKAEKTGMEAVQQAHSLLEQSRAKIGFVLNQSKSHVPRALCQDLLNEG